MSFERSNFINGRNQLKNTAIESLSSAPFSGENLAPVIHRYTSVTDNVATITSSGYFDELAVTDPKPEDFSLPLIRVGDLILASSSGMPLALQFDSVTVPYTTSLFGM